MVAPGFIAIGSGPAGLTAAEMFRREHPKIPVRIITSDPALPYAKPPLSKAYLCGRDPNLDLHSAGWFVKHGIRAAPRHHRRPHRSRQPGSRHGCRSALRLLAPGAGHGATPVPLDVPGGDAALSLRSFADAVVLRMAAKNSDSAVVVGGGLIGCEAASCLAARGVTRPSSRPNRCRCSDGSGSKRANGWRRCCPTSAFDSSASTNVTAVDDSDVTLDSGATVEADLVVSATGVRSDSRLATAAGIDTAGGRIVVDERMHSSAPNVYAAGDVALAYNVTARRRIPSEHWRDATEQGRIAGLVAAGYSRGLGRCARITCAIGAIRADLPRLGHRIPGQPPRREPRRVHRDLPVR